MFPQRKTFQLPCGILRFVHGLPVIAGPRLAWYFLRVFFFYYFMGMAWETAPRKTSVGGTITADPHESPRPPPPREDGRLAPVVGFPPFANLSRRVFVSAFGGDKTNKHNSLTNAKYPPSPPSRGRPPPRWSPKSAHVLERQTCFAGNAVPQYRWPLGKIRPPLLVCKVVCPLPF